MNHVTSDKSSELVPWSDSLIVGFYLYICVLYVTHTQLSFMRTELYQGLEEGFLPNMLPLIDVLFHVA